MKPMARGASSHQNLGPTTRGHKLSKLDSIRFEDAFDAQTKRVKADSFLATWQNNKHLASSAWSPEDNYGLHRIVSRAKLSEHDFVAKRLEEGACKELDDLAKEYLSLTDLNAKVEWLLMQEYGYILRSLEHASYGVKKIDKAHLIFPAKKHKANLDQNAIAAYSKEIAARKTPQAKKIPLGIVRATPKGYKALDGYHRLSSSENIPDQEIYVISVL